MMRAQTHLDALNAEAEAWVQANLPTMRLEFYSQSGEYILYVETCAQPPLRLGVILGDAVHNLRSAVDHLMWQVVLADGGEPTDKTCFPIFDSPTKFQKQVVKPRERGKASPLLGVSDDTLAAVERHQPYHAQEGQAYGLGIVHTLSNIDKHQVVHPAIASLNERPPSVGGSGFDFIDMRWRPVVIREGAELARFFLLRGHRVTRDANVNVQPNFPIDIRFGEIGIPLTHVTQTANAVAHVVRFFCEGFFLIEPPTADA